jgi:hypothetical protein
LQRIPDYGRYKSSNCQNRNQTRQAALDLDETWTRVIFQGDIFAIYTILRKHRVHRMRHQGYIRAHHLN